MAMNQASLAKFEDRVKAGGVLPYNETLIDTPPKRGMSVSSRSRPMKLQLSWGTHR